MHLIRTRPFKLAHEVEASFQTFPRPAAYRLGLRDSRFGAQAWLPRIDVIESDTALAVRYELAGFRLEDLEVTLDDNLLTVKGTRSPVIPEGASYRIQELADGVFSRSIRVAEHFDPDKVEARLSDGILEVVLEKHPDVLPRTIEIESA